MTEKPRPIIITVALDTDTYKALTEAAKRLGVSRSRIVHRALQFYLAREGFVIEDVIGQVFRMHLLSQALSALNLGLTGAMAMAIMSDDAEVRKKAFGVAEKAARLADRLLGKIEEHLEKEFRNIGEVEKSLEFLKESELGLIARFRLEVERERRGKEGGR